MAEFQIFGRGFVYMIFLISVGIMMAFAGGTVIDRLTMGSAGEMLMNNTHVTPEWQSAQDSGVWFFINIYYFICYALPVLGVVIFIQSILPTTTGDRYV